MLSYWPKDDIEPSDFTEFEASVERFVDDRLVEFGTNLGSAYLQVQRVEPIRPTGSLSGRGGLTPPSVMPSRSN